MTGNGQIDAGLAIFGPDTGEQHAHELAHRIRELAATDPQLAQELVDQLIAALDRATDGAFRDQLYAAGVVPSMPADASERDGRAYSSPGNS